MLFAAIALFAAAGAGPLDGRYSLADAPGQCVRPVGEPDSPTVISPGRLDAYEQLCEWGSLRRQGPGRWAAKGRCVAEGRESPGMFRFVVRDQILSIRRPDGSTNVLRRCADLPPPPVGVPVN